MAACKEASWQACSPSMIIHENSWAQSLSPPIRLGITSSIFAVSFSQHCLPLVVYTDGLSLFGHDSMSDDRDPCPEFQRAFSALGVTHLAAPSPQPKEKSNAALEPSNSAWSRCWPTNRSAIIPLLKLSWIVKSPTKMPPSAAPPVTAPTWLGPRPLRKSAQPYALARPPPCWTSIWHSICAAGSMPISRSTFWAAVGPSLQPNAPQSP
jgi:hypothetical protein